MEPFVWRNRLVKLQEGSFMLSAVGRHDDFDLFPEKNSDEMAFAGNCGFGGVLDLEAIDENRLRITCADGRYVIVGDKVLSDAKIERED